MFSPNPSGPRKSLANATKSDLVAHLIAFTVIGVSMIGVGVAKIVMRQEPLAFYLAFICLATVTVGWAYFTYLGELIRHNRRTSH